MNEWEMQTNNNIIAASKEMNSARPMRAYIDTIIKQTIDDLNSQKNATDEAFRKRIEETKEVKTKLEIQHSEVYHMLYICIKKKNTIYLYNSKFHKWKYILFLDNETSKRNDTKHNANRKINCREGRLHGLGSYKIRESLSAAWFGAY